jgi:hypothetical protein
VTRAQLWILTAGAIALLGCLLFPPWLGISEWADGHANRDPCQRYFLLTPPTTSRVPRELQAKVDDRRQAGAVLYQGPQHYVVDWARQIIPISVVTAATLVGLVILRRRA